MLAYSLLSWSAVNGQSTVINRLMHIDAKSRWWAESATNNIILDVARSSNAQWMTYYWSCVAWYFVCNSILFLFTFLILSVFIFFQQNVKGHRLIATLLRGGWYSQKWAVEQRSEVHKGKAAVKKRRMAEFQRHASLFLSWQLHCNLRHKNAIVHNQLLATLLSTVSDSANYVAATYCIWTSS